MSFSNPADPQISSAFVQLPAELLTRILRLLHNNNGSISRFKDRSANDENASLIDLSAQLLSTCQYLYHESYHVLYDENMLDISCKAGADEGEHPVLLAGSVELKIASASVDFDCELECIDHDHDLLKDALRGENTARVSNSLKSETDLVMLKALNRGYSGLLKIQNFSCNFPKHYNQVDLHLMGLTLEHLLRGKRVSVRLWDPLEEVADWELKHILALKVLRCKSICFEDVSCDESARSIIDDVVSTITSQNPPSDLLMKFKAIRDRLQQVPERLIDWMPDPQWRSEYRALAIIEKPVCYDDGETYRYGMFIGAVNHDETEFYAARRAMTTEAGKCFKEDIEKARRALKMLDDLTLDSDEEEDESGDSHQV